MSSLILVRIRVFILPLFSLSQLSSIPLNPASQGLQGRRKKLADIEEKDRCCPGCGTYLGTVSDADYDLYDMLLPHLRDNPVCPGWRSRKGDDRRQK